VAALSGESTSRPLMTARTAQVFARSSETLASTKSVVFAIGTELSFTSEPPAVLR
jgi:hypothetical protein